MSLSGSATLKQAEREEREDREDLKRCRNLKIRRWRLESPKKWEKVEQTVSWLGELESEESCSNLLDGADICVVHANARHSSQCDACREALSKALQIEPSWWTKCMRKSNGYFGVKETFDDKGEVSGVNTWCRFLMKHVDNSPNSKGYKWLYLNFYTRWIRATNQTILFSFDTVSLLRQDDKLDQLAVSGVDAHLLHDPFATYLGIINEVVSLQDDAVWAVNKPVRQYEKANISSDGRPHHDFRHLHDIGRHVIHVVESLGLSIKTIHHMMKHHEEIAAALAINGNQIRRVRQRLLSQEYLLDGVRYRCNATKERLAEEVRLTFNMIAQYDSTTAVKIGQAAQRDSSAMRTIAIMTLIFLPGTFISAMFGMQFFDYDNTAGTMSVSKKFWIYWVFTIPITAITLLVWYFWPQEIPIGQEFAAQSDEKKSKRQDILAHGRQLLLDLEAQLPFKKSSPEVELTKS